MIARFLAVCTLMASVIASMSQFHFTPATPQAEPSTSAADHARLVSGFTSASPSGGLHGDHASGVLTKASSPEGTEVAVSRDPGDGITLKSDDVEIQILLPFSESAESGLVLEGIGASYDNGNGSHSVTVPHDDGSVQVFTIIDNSGAPSSYTYELTSSAAFTPQINEDGSFFLLSEDGAFLAYGHKPWAIDANGVDVPTRYEFSAEGLTQVIDHSAEYAYPIVADPWLGIQLFTSFSTSTWNGDIRYTARVTNGGVAIWASQYAGGGLVGYTAARIIFDTNGWDEWKARWPAITNKATLQQQYRCHITPGLLGLPFTGAYDLERARANKSEWLTTARSHLCNW